MPTTTDVRRYRETVLEQGKTALGEARKPLFAAVGATNLAYDQLRTQLKDLPAETQGQLKKLQGETQGQLKKLQEEAQTQLKKLQERAQDRAAALDPTEVSARVRRTVEEYANQAAHTYESLVRRGEKLVRQARRDRRVRHAFTETEQLVERAEEAVTGRPATPPQTKATRTATKAPARKAPARRPATKA